MRAWFTYPLALHLLWLLPALVVLGVLTWRWRRDALAQLGPLTAVRALVSGGSPLRGVRAACWGLGAITLALASAVPRWGRAPVHGLAPGRDLIAVLDLSRSMLARDVWPSRVDQAKKALLDLSRAVEQRGGHRLALVVFAARPRVACPLTHDYDHFRAAVQAQDAAAPHPDIRPTGEQSVSGTRIGAALQCAADMGERDYKDIILISDGDDPVRDGEAVRAAAEMASPVHVIGLGDPERLSPVPGKGDEPLQHEGRPVLTRLEEEPLREIARRTRGTYTPARTQTVRLGELFHEIVEPAAARADLDSALTVTQPRHLWFLAVALVFFTLDMVIAGRADSRRRVWGASPPGRSLVSWPEPGSARAAGLFLPVVLGLVSASPPHDPPDLLRQAVAAFRRQDYTACLRLCEQAEARATDPGLVAFNKAAALYQLGLTENDPRGQWELFKRAEQHYRYCLEDATGLRRARALFDLGNALVQQAQDRDARLLEQAIAAFEQCLREAATTDSLATDARYNLELAKTLWLVARAKRPQSEPEPESGAPATSPRAPRPDVTTQPNKAGRPGEPDKLQPAPGKVGDSAQAGTTTQPPPPGKGNIPPLPDEEDVARLTAEELAEHLRLAAERITRERADHYHRAVPTLSRIVKDW